MPNTQDTPQSMRLHGPEILAVLVLTLLFLGTSFVYSAVQNKTPEPTPSVELSTPSQTSTSTEPQFVSLTDSENPFLNLSVSAQAVYVYDLTYKKVLYQKNADMVLPLASLTKLMTAYTVDKLLPENSLVFIQKNFLTKDGDAQLIDHESWIARDLLDYTLTISSNDGAVALAAAAGTVQKATDLSRGREIFIQKMNEYAQSLGLTETTFLNESGLDIDETHAGAVGTAHDMTTLLEYLLIHSPRLLEATRYQSFEIVTPDNVTRRAINTNNTLAQMPNIIASKTGFTDLAGGNLIIAYDASINRPIIITVLGSTYNDRFTDMLHLINATNTYIALQNRE